MSKLENKVALITGASSGIGAKTAKLFAKEGASVVLMARRKERLEKLVEEIKAEGGKAVAVGADVTSNEDVKNAVDTAINEFGRVDIGANIAGYTGFNDLADDVSDDMWDKVIDINLTGPMRVFRAVIPEMLKTGGGTFVTVASTAGLVPCGGVDYVSSKYGVVGLARNVAFSYRNDNIRSNVIAPGPIATDMLAGLQKECNPRGMERLESKMGDTKPGAPEDIANIALFLASDESKIVNGAVIPADFGSLTL